jgi:putative ABC transport system substrate-binding protein
MRRREFIALLGGVTVACPIVVQAQQSERLRRIGVLLAVAPNNPEYPALLQAFLQTLQQLGWTDGRNLSVDVRWAGANPEGIRKHAGDLVALGSELIVAPGSASAGPLLQVTRSVPVVFTIVPDPVGAGFVDSLARPSGNATGFTSFEYSIGAKWLDLLKQIAPGVTRVGVLRDLAITAGIGQWNAIHSAAPSFRIEVSPIDSHEAVDIERGLADIERSANGGLVVTSGSFAIRHRDLIIRTAAERKLPAIYYAEPFVAVGGLISYGADRTDQFRQAAGYVDRILRGEKPGDLPVQAPTQYKLALNMKAARALDLAVPESLLARADEVIE